MEFLLCYWFFNLIDGYILIVYDFCMQAVYEQRVKEVAMAVPLLCCAFDSFNVAAKRQIIIAGARNAPDSEALLTACHAPFDPDKTVSTQNRNCFSSFFLQPSLLSFCLWPEASY